MRIKEGAEENQIGEAAVAEGQQPALRARATAGRAVGPVCIVIDISNLLGCNVDVGNRLERVMA